MARNDQFMRIVEGCFPPGFFVRVIEELEQVYPSAHTHCHGRFDTAEAADLYPYERRARAETVLRDVAKEFGHRGISAEAKANATNSNFHSEAVSGSVVLTESYVQKSGELVELADFRQQLAESAQLRLMGADEAGTLFYAIVLHGYRREGKHKFPYRLGFVELAIPNKECTGYLDVFDLVNRYAAADVDPADRAAAAADAVATERVRKPSALLIERRRLISDDRSSEE
jgi:hypothetical protein